jgi:hypothetical protein
MFYEPKEWKEVSTVKHVNNCGVNRHVQYQIGEDSSGEPLKLWMNESIYDKVLKGEFVIKTSKTRLIIVNPENNYIVSSFAHVF